MELKNLFDLFKSRNKTLSSSENLATKVLPFTWQTPRTWEKEQQKLMKSRPAELQQSYGLCEDQEKVNQVFTELRSSLIAVCQKSRENNEGDYFLETGSTLINRGYLFLQPYNSPGWLFEQGPAGWIICYARKISQRNMFVRQGEVIDFATVYLSSLLEAQTRISSPALFGSALYTLDYYAENVLGRLKEKSFLLAK